jgi:outer membrane protein assembly factor BamB
VRHRPTVANGQIYLSANDGRCYALRAADGKVQWSTPIATAVYVNDIGAPVYANGGVYAPSHDQRLYLLDAATGAVRQTYTAAQILTESPVVTDTVVYLPVDTLVALDATTLALRWRGKNTGSCGTPALAGDRLLVTNNIGNVFALAAADGRSLWRYTATTDLLSPLPAVGDGAVYFGDTDGDLVAVDLATGRERWRRPAGNNTVSPAVANGLVFSGGADRYLYGIRTGDGATQWRATTSVAGAYGIVTAADGLVYACDNAGVTALNASTGALAWRAATDLGGGAGVGGGVAYVADNAGHVTAISTAPAG